MYTVAMWRCRVVFWRRARLKRCSLVQSIVKLEWFGTVMGTRRKKAITYFTQTKISHLKTVATTWINNSFAVYFSTNLPTMKVTALLLIILGLLLVVVLGLMLLFLSIMVVGTPGPASRSGGLADLYWLFLPLLAFIVVLFFAATAYRAGNYTRSVWFASVFGVAVIGIIVYMGKTSSSALQEIRAANAQAAEEERLYPIQKFLRPVEGGADTIIVFPSRIVAYRLYVEGGIPFAGPVGDLNVARDTIVVSDREFVERVKREELPQFVDGEGRKLTDVFAIRWEAPSIQKSE